MGPMAKAIVYLLAMTTLFGVMKGLNDTNWGQGRGATGSGGSYHAGGGSFHK